MALLNSRVLGGGRPTVLRWGINRYASAGPLAAGTLQAIPGNTTVLLGESAITGGSQPYSTQFYRAPDAGGSPGTYAPIGSPVSGATPSYVDSGIVPGTTLWYKAQTTDASSNTVTSNQASATTLTTTFVTYSITMEPTGFITG